MGMIDSKQLLHKAIELAEHQAEFRESLKESISNFADAAEESRDRAKDIDDEVLLAKIEEHIAMAINAKEECERYLAVAPQPNSDVVSSLLPFDIETLPDNLMDSYAQWATRFGFTGNSYWAIEIFTLFVRAGVCPPKWVLEHIADGFSKHLSEPDRDPDQLAKCLGIKGVASGAKNPGKEQRLWVERTPMMVDMGKLVSCYDFSQMRAAQAIKAKYDLCEAPHTIKKQFVAFFQGSVPVKARSSAELSEYERTTFESSFPASTKHLFK